MSLLPAGDAGLKPVFPHRWDAFPRQTERLFPILVNRPDNSVFLHLCGCRGVGCQLGRKAHGASLVAIRAPSFRAGFWPQLKLRWRMDDHNERGSLGALLGFSGGPASAASLRFPHFTKEAGVRGGQGPVSGCSIRPLKPRPSPATKAVQYSHGVELQPVPAWSV